MVLDVHVDLRRFGGEHRGDGAALGQVLTQVHIFADHPAVKGSAHLGAHEVEPRLLHLGLGTLQAGLVLGYLGLLDQQGGGLAELLAAVLVQQLPLFPGAGRLFLGSAQAGLRRLHRGLGQGKGQAVVLLLDLHEQLALFERAAGHQMGRHVDHPPGHLGGQNRLSHRDHRALAVDAHLHRLVAHLHDAHHGSDHLGHLARRGLLAKGEGGQGGRARGQQEHHQGDLPYHFLADGHDCLLLRLGQDRGLGPASAQSSIQGYAIG